MARVPTAACGVALPGRPCPHYYVVCGQHRERASRRRCQREQTSDQRPRYSPVHCFHLFCTRAIPRPAPHSPKSAPRINYRASTDILQKCSAPNLQTSVASTTSTMGVAPDASFRTRTSARRKSRLLDTICVNCMPNIIVSAPGGARDRDLCGGGRACVRALSQAAGWRDGGVPAGLADEPKRDRARFGRGHGGIQQDV